MSQHDPSIPIDDSTLKRSVRAAWGKADASPDLRRRVLMAMTRTVLEEPIPETTRSPRFWDRVPMPVRAAAGIAALLLFAAGTTWGILEYQARPSYVRPIKSFVAPPAQPTLYALLVSRHEDFSSGADADTPPPAHRIAAVRDALAAQVKHPVWLPDLTKLGWKAAGVRVYSVGGVSAVAFNFERGPDEISAFSLPTGTHGDECIDGGIPDIDLLVDGRSVAGFGADGQLYALVGSRGSAPYPQAELRTLVNQFRDDPACLSSCPVP
jgi:hypothetical protein